jgi:hypothetical protein
MRRTYISPEFEYKKVRGTLSMSEESSFFGSKMLEIEDRIQIKNENIIYYQGTNGEQIDFAAERNLPQVIYNTVADKGSNHKLFLDDSQKEVDRNAKTAWVLDIQIKTILENYLFATMKKWRTFEGVTNDVTYNKNINFALLEYIDKNVINRYKFSRIDFYLKPIDLLTIGRLKWQNNWDVNIENSSNLFKRFQTETDTNDLDIRLKFYQSQAGSQASFDYYFNLYFEKL